MHPFFVIFGRTVPAYGLCAAAGFAAGILLTGLLSRRRGLDVEDGIYIFVMSAIFALVGAKALYLLTAIPAIKADLADPGLTALQVAARHLGGGFVFYGGLIGAVFGFWFWSRYFKKEPEAEVQVLLPAAVLAAGFGRTGCFMAGCCYGKPTDLPVGVVFSNSPFAPNGVALFPTQLTEAAFDFALCAILAVYGRRHEMGKKSVAVYVLVYAVFRFALEFLRGDAGRGYIGPLSVSQWISLVLAAAALIFIGVGYGQAKTLPGAGR